MNAVVSSPPWLPYKRREMFEKKKWRKIKRICFLSTENRWNDSYAAQHSPRTVKHISEIKSHKKQIQKKKQTENTNETSWMFFFCFVVFRITFSIQHTIMQSVFSLLNFHFVCVCSFRCWNHLRNTFRSVAIEMWASMHTKLFISKKSNKRCTTNDVLENSFIQFLWKKQNFRISSVHCSVLVVAVLCQCVFSLQRNFIFFI